MQYSYELNTLTCWSLLQVVTPSQNHPVLNDSEKRRDGWQTMRRPYWCQDCHCAISHDEERKEQLATVLFTTQLIILHISLHENRRAPCTCTLVVTVHHIHVSPHTRRSTRPHPNLSSSNSSFNPLLNPIRAYLEPQPTKHRILRWPYLHSQTYSLSLCQDTCQKYISSPETKPSRTADPYKSHRARIYEGTSGGSLPYLRDSAAHAGWARTLTFGGLNLLTSFFCWLDVICLVWVIFHVWQTSSQWTLWMQER